MIVDCAYYKDGLRQGMSSMPLEEAAGLRGQGGFVWLGLFEPDAEELAQIHETLGLHELAIEDAQILHRRPKIELRAARRRLEQRPDLLTFGTASVLWARYPATAGGNVHHVHAVSFRATPSPPSRR